MSKQDNPADEQDQVVEQESVEQAEAEAEVEAMQEVTVESLQVELQAVLAQADSHKDEAIRAQAEMQNIRRRAELDVSKAHKFGQEKLITELLGLVDNLERAITASKAENATLENLLEGVEMSQTMLLEGLKKFNVEQLDPHGEPFNPELHEAMTAIPNPDMEPNTIMEVFQKGYTLNGRLMRPAMVVVSK
ncbi:MAG: nucleotide exchange factor GrpE [Gammaproteobacteria bacterium]|jgi:molecular chaperone GrpE|nr:nucleotide exchange factor GrpE [Gammaproteobacteria bacterium]